MATALRALLSDESGATAIEYALLVALISIGIIAGTGALGSELFAMFDFITTTIEAAVGI